jgi:hypothetical protein
MTRPRHLGLVRRSKSRSFLSQGDKARVASPQLHVNLVPKNPIEESKSTPFLVSRDTSVSMRLPVLDSIRLTPGG